MIPAAATKESVSVLLPVCAKGLGEVQRHQRQDGTRWDDDGPCGIVAHINQPTP